MLSLSRSQCPHDLAEAGAFAVHQQVDAKQLGGDPQAASDGGDQHGHAGDELPGGHAGDGEPQHHQDGCGERHQADHDPDGAVGEEHQQRDEPERGDGHQREQQRNTVDEFQPLRGCFYATLWTDGSMDKQESGTMVTLTSSLSVIGSSATRASGNALLVGWLGRSCPLPRPQCPHDLAEAGAFAVHQQVDTKQLRGDPQPAKDEGDQHGHAGDELPGGHAGDAEPQHHQHR